MTLSMLGNESAFDSKSVICNLFPAFVGYFLLKAPFFTFISINSILSVECFLGTFRLFALVLRSSCLGVGRRSKIRLLIFGQFFVGNQPLELAL